MVKGIRHRVYAICTLSVRLCVWHIPKSHVIVRMPLVRATLLQLSRRPRPVNKLLKRQEVYGVFAASTDALPCTLAVALLKLKKLLKSNFRALGNQSEAYAAVDVLLLELVAPQFKLFITFYS